MRRIAPQWLRGCVLRAVLLRAHLPQARRGSCAPVCRSTWKTRATTTTPPSSPGGCRRWRFKALRLQAPDYPLWRDFAYEYEHDRLAIDLINGGPLLREWVDDVSAAPEVLEAAAAADEAAWAEARAPFLLY